MVWFLFGAACGIIAVIALHWLMFPFVTAYIVKDPRVHCSACGIAIPKHMSQCPSCTRPVCYAISVDEIDQ